MAFVAVDENATDDPLLGEVRISVFPGSAAAEFAIFIHPRARRQGIGRALLLKMIRYCSDRGFAEIIGQIAPENEQMLALARSAGMKIHRIPGVGVAVAHLNLSGPAHAANAPLANSATPSAHRPHRSRPQDARRNENADPAPRRHTLGVTRSSARSAYQSCGNGIAERDRSRASTLVRQCVLDVMSQPR